MQLIYRSDIGMHTINRGRESCLYATPFCFNECYGNKFEKMYPNCIPASNRRESEWSELSVQNFANEIYSLVIRTLNTDYTHNKNTCTAIRFCAVRGDTFGSIDYWQDVEKIRATASLLPYTKFWIPTRGWRIDGVRTAIESLFDIPNVYILASVDPYSMKHDKSALSAIKKTKWRTMSFGDNTGKAFKNLGKLYKCPKTFKHRLGFCGTGKCTNGCFSKSNPPINVLLKQHS